MRYRQIGSSSLQSSVIGLGALHFGVFCDQTATNNIIHQALDLGINFIDTAPMYGHGNSESYIRNALRGRRDKVILSTKVGLEPRVAPDGTFTVSVVRLNRSNIRNALHKSLLSLGVDYIDLYQLHAFDPATPLLETLTALDELVKEGKIRFIGCSNYNRLEYEQTASLIREHHLTPLVSFQVQFNLIERRAEQDIFPALKSSEIGVICNRALARGILTGKYAWNQSYPEGSRGRVSQRVSRWITEATLTLVAELDKWAREQKRTGTELALSWLTSKPEVSVVLVGMRNLEQVRMAAAATEWKLTGSDLREVDAIIERLNLMPQVQTRPETFFET